jgi:hypothetical protein
VYVALLYPSVQRTRQAHERAFEEVTCTDDKCETAAYTKDSKGEAADYIIDTKTRFFVDAPSPNEENPETFAPLDYSDVAFISKFRQPMSYETLDGETWRLYSRDSEIDDQRFEIMVGFALRAPWKMADTEHPEIDVLDDTLRKEAYKLAASIHSARTPRGAGVDGYQIVDSRTQKVLDWGSWLPTFLPPSIGFPNSGVRLYMAGGNLCVVQADIDGRLLAISLLPLGPLFGIAVLGTATFVVSFWHRTLVESAFLTRIFWAYGCTCPSS